MISYDTKVCRNCGTWLSLMGGTCELTNEGVGPMNQQCCLVHQKEPDILSTNSDLHLSSYTQSQVAKR